MEGWEHKPLCEICGFQRGLTYAKSDEVDSPGHTVLRANNIDLASHELNFNELKFISDSVAVPASKVVRLGSLLVCTASGSKAHLGKVAYIDSDYGYAFGGFMGQLTPSKGVDGRYLFYALTSPGYKDFIEALSDGVNINNLKFDDLGRFSVPLPPLPEQRRLVAILDEAFEAIATAKANTEKNLQNTRDAFLAYRTAVLSTGGDEWDERQLGAVCVLQRGLDLPSRDRKPGPYPLLSSSGLIDTHVEGPVRGPGVVTGRSGSIGSVFYVEQDFWPLNTVLYVRDFCGNHPRFVYHLLEHFDLKRFASGAGVPTLNRNIVHEEIVLVPQSLSAQEKVADSLDKLYAACQKVEKVHVKKVSALDELKKSLLHQAFTGQLTAKSTDQQLEAVA